MFLAALYEGGDTDYCALSDDESFALPINSLPG
jgi:hypothetical protein